MTPHELTPHIHDWAQAMGFQAVGITDVDLNEHKPRVRDWLARGCQGTMGYLERNLEKRLHPDLLEPGTCRVISARMDYLPPDTEPLRVLGDPSLGYVSRYALGRDYHKVLRRRLAKLAARINEHLPEFRYRAFTDSAPVLEKALGAKCGLGWMGKHTLLLDQRAGSWFFLGEIYTNAPLTVTANTQKEDACGQCKACITVCPTRAITGPRQLDARRCISYLTIEHKGAIPVDLREAIGNRVFGCDDCQLYCPWNRYATPTSEPDFAPRHGLDSSPLHTLFSWTEEDFLQKTEGSAMRRISYQQWRRNLAVALGNGPADDSTLATLNASLPAADALVAEHIQWAIMTLEARRAQTPSSKTR